MMLLLLLRPLLGVAAAAPGHPHPVSRHIGRWTEPPRKCPSTMVTDAPIMANGDMGAAVCHAGGKSGGAVDVSFYLGKMDFWTQTHGPNATYKTPRHLATHVAAGYVALAVTPPTISARGADTAAAAVDGQNGGGWSCSLFNCSCVGLVEYYGVVPGVGFGCAPPPAQVWWASHACGGSAHHPAVGCCKGPACSMPGAAPCAHGCGHHPSPPPSPPPGPPTPGPAPSPLGSGFTASQMLQTARVNVTRSAAPHLPTIHLSSIVAATSNVLLTRLTVDRPAVLELSLGAANPLDLPIKAGHTTAALTLHRAANAWLDNSAVLLECDAGISILGETVIFTDALSPSLMKDLLEVEGGAAE